MARREWMYSALWAAATGLVLFSITKVEHWGLPCLMVLLLCLAGVQRDAAETPWVIFMPAGCAMLSLFYLIYSHAGGFWYQVVAWQTKSIHHWFHWNEFFNAIPGNDAAWFRIWQPEWLTQYMKAVYSYGFTLSYWVCVIRAFFTKDISKFARYSLAGYLLQVPLILPFYNTVLLQEVWYVQGTPDVMGRGWTPEEQGANSVNCFPSMHTSIAFAALLLAKRENSTIYRIVMTLFTCSIIASTMYLKIHWVIDVIAGMLFAYFCVKLADRIVDSRPFQSFAALWERIGTSLYRTIAVKRSADAVEPSNPETGGTA
ncbi:phosphatase PAP2 family protein [Paenibacillus chartarius]|uniref:Phosphatase PAP2 family protein n=1 Tax=Paenibacillus chartarius TaxID=747481 RepID=A0ABV6DQZ2_9BACL